MQTALYWLRWSYAARRVPDAFLFTWMAVEQLAGVEEITSLCQACRKSVACEAHGPHIYTGTSRWSIKNLLDKHDVSIPNRLLDLRQPFVHGSLVYSFEKRLHMSQMLPDLRHAVEEELRERLGARAAIPSELESETLLQFQISGHPCYLSLSC